MDFTIYLSFFHPNEEKGSKYQIPIEMNDEDLDLSKSEERINSKLQWYFYMVLNETPSYIIGFINFHYEQFTNKNQGQEIDFFFFIESCIGDIPHEVSIKMQWGFKSKEYEKKRKIISDWIDKKKKELEPETKPSILEKPKHLNHSQQMALLDEVGILSFLDKFNLTKQNKAKLIALFINRDPQNTREFLTYGEGKGKISLSKQKHIYKTPVNINFTHKILSSLGIS